MGKAALKSPARMQVAAAHQDQGIKRNSTWNRRQQNVAEALG